MKYRKRKIRTCGFCCKEYYKRDMDYYSHVLGSCILTRTIEDLIRLNMEQVTIKKEKEYDRI